MTDLPPESPNLGTAPGAVITHHVAPVAVSRPLPGLDLGDVTETGKNYDDTVNDRRRRLAFSLLFAAVLSFLGMLTMIVLVAITLVSPANATLPIASLAAITAFFVGSARKDLIPYQFLHATKSDAPDTADRVVAIGEQGIKFIKELKS